MYELNDLNLDVMRAELGYRRERLISDRRFASTGRGRWLRAQRRPARTRNS